LIVAATNYPALLDKALYRRFDDVLEYGLPTGEMIVTVFRSRLAAFNTRAIDWSGVAQVAQGLSQADIVRAAEDAAKSAILDDAAGMDTERLIQAVNERQRTGSVDSRP
jgi:AAA+ superfamily predicted ATPase